MKRTNKHSTVRLKKSVKNDLMELDFAKKNMSFEDIIVELINSYKKR